MQNATLRPKVMEVRDRIQEVLVGECGVEALCCAKREWGRSAPLVGFSDADFEKFLQGTP